MSPCQRLAGPLQQTNNIRHDTVQHTQLQADGGASVLNTREPRRVDAIANFVQWDSIKLLLMKTINTFNKQDI